MNGLLKPQSGLVEVMGRRAGDYGARSWPSRWPYVPQSQYNLFPRNGL